MYAKKASLFPLFFIITEAEVIKDVKPAPEKRGLSYHY